MTREEIISAISDDKMMPFIQPEQLAKIVDFVIKNCNPSLFSNLDEAADNYAENILANGEDMFDAIADAFKAGAVWMAGQEKRLRMEVDLKKKIMKEELGVIKLWFDTIRNHAVTKRNANGILLSDTRMLEIIALSAKDASEYIELLLGGLI